MKMKKAKVLLGLAILIPTLAFGTIYNGNVTYFDSSLPATNEVPVFSGIPGSGQFRVQSTPVTINPTTGAISGGAFTPTSISVSTSAPGANALISVANTSNTANSGSLFRTTVAGSSAGDPMLQYVITGEQTWTTGIDNSVGGNPYVIAASTALGTTNALSLTTAGQGTFTGAVVAAGATLTGTTGINGSGAGVTTIGTGGTGAVNIGNATGNTAVTGSLGATTTLTAGTGITATTGNIAASAGNVSASGTVVAGTTVTAGTGVIATTGNVAASAGAVNAATTMTATLGAITATNGNLVLGTAGNKLAIATGANASVGTATLLNGTVTVSDTDVTASSIIFLTRESIGTTGANPVGMITVGTVTPATSFVINAVTTATATSVVGSDESVVGYMIVN